MMEFAPCIDKKRHIYGTLHHGSLNSLYHSHNNSSHSLQVPTKTSAYIPNIEKQLQSLLIEEEDTQEDTAELLQQTFAQLDVELNPASTKSLSHSSTEKSTSYQSSQILEEEGHDFSAFTSPFSEQPVVTGTYSYYIPAPTSVRKYLDYPDASILKNMSLPYPLRVREPKSRRLEKIKDDHILRLMNTMKPRNNNKRRPSAVNQTKRHSLDMGQMDGLLKIMDDMTKYGKAHRPSFSESVLSHQALQNIISWLPDKNMEWQDTGDEENNTPKISIESDIPMVHPLDR